MKLCLGCMNPIHDRRESCPYCEYREREGVKNAFYLIPGTTLKKGAYSLGKVLGSGGFGVTYIAWDNAANKKVVVKEYVPELLTARSHGKAALKPVSADAAQQFRAGKENFTGVAKMMCKNRKTDNIEVYYDCFEENGTAYAVMEYLNGLSLQKIMENGKVFTFQQAKFIIRQVLEGLQYLHGQGILHMDISPTNIFLTADDQVKILDAGSFRYTPGTFKSLSNLARNGFAAEEQYRSNGELGPWTDVYGVGAVMYQMITGIQPPSAQQRAAEDTLSPISEYASLPKNAENIIWNSLVLSSNKRIQTAEEFYQALDKKQKMTKVVEKKKKGSSAVKIGVAAAVLCIVCIGGFFVIHNQLEKNQDPLKNTVAAAGDIRIPNLMGMDEKEAQGELEKIGLKLKVAEVNYSSTVPKGEITWQKPENGEKAASGDTIKVKRSGGEEEVMIADLIGKSREKAETWLKNQHLDSDVVWISDAQNDALYSEEQEEGTILGSSLEANQLYRLGSGKLELQVCQGSLAAKTDELAVPDLSGTLLNDAVESVLPEYKGEQGYTFSLVDEEQISYDFSWAYDQGTIIAQEPAAGTAARTNKKLQVTVARELQEVTVPDVIGMNLEEAKQVLEDAHLIVGGQASEYSDTVSAGQVYALTDNDGNPVKAGISMREKEHLGISYSKGPRPAPQPEAPSYPTGGGGYVPPANGSGDNGDPGSGFMDGGTFGS